MEDELFWVLAVALTALVIPTVLWPVFRRAPGEVAPRAAHDAEVYGAQLAELQEDVARGTLAPEEARTARAEIGRRLLRVLGEAEAADGGGPSSKVGSLRFAGSVALVILSLGALGFYAWTGSPDAPDLPLEARLAVDPAEADVPTLLAQIEAKLRANPEDGRGWDMLAPIYLRAGRSADAADAAGRAIRILGPTADREATLGEAQARVAGGEVTTEAKASFERALALDPSHMPARFFLALALSQEGQPAEAAAAWRKLIADSPQDAPWLEVANLALRDAEAKGAAPAPQPGPTAADVEAAGRMEAGDRQAMIEGMVSQLATRLKSAPNDAEGWKRLMRSYTVLGRTADAQAALGQARAVFAAGTPERGGIDAFAAGLGLTDGETP